MEVVFIILISAALGIALGKALDMAPIPLWVQWALLAATLLAGVLFLRGTIDL